jgi:hypothetical protein
MIINQAGIILKVLPLTELVRLRIVLFKQAIVSDNGTTSALLTPNQPLRLNMTSWNLNKQKGLAILQKDKNVRYILSSTLPQ